MLKTGVAGHRTLTGGSVNAAAVVAKGNGRPDLPTGSGFLRPSFTNGLSSFVALDVGAVCANVPLTKSAKNAIDPAEGDLKATDLNLDLCP